MVSGKNPGRSILWKLKEPEDIWPIGWKEREALMSKAGYPFDSWLKKQLKNPRFRKAYQKYELSAKLAAQISALRTRKKWTQAQLAEKIDSCQEVISRLEGATRSSVSIQTLERLARAFDKRLDIRFL